MSIRVEDLKPGHVIRYGGHVWEVDRVRRDTAVSTEGRSKYQVAVKIKVRLPGGNRELGGRDTCTFAVPAGTLFDRD
ncbi:MAG: hypothetical protein EXQ86_11925 [Rhodospirillales bacterium]|nr:hypothetical protein [Rhodospirillales bacterium]